MRRVVRLLTCTRQSAGGKHCRSGVDDWLLYDLQLKKNYVHGEKKRRSLCQRRKERKENMSVDESEETCESERGGRDYPRSTRQDTHATHMCTPVNIRTVYAGLCTDRSTAMFLDTLTRDAS